MIRFLARLPSVHAKAGRGRFPLVVGVAFSAAALRLRQLLPAPPIPKVSTARPRSPQANAAALDPLRLPSRAPRGVGPALLGRQIAPASAVSLSSSARPPPPPTPPRARGGVALLIVVHDGPAVAATGLPPVSSSVPTPLAEAESAHLSPPPTTDPKPHPGPSGHGKERKKTDKLREGWEDGTPPPHTWPSCSLRALGALGVQSLASHPGPGS